MGRAVLKNLARVHGPGIPGQSEASSVLGRPAFPNIAAVPEVRRSRGHRHARGDGAGHHSLSVRRRGVHAAIIISAGFKECGPAGAELEQASSRRSAAKRHANHRSELPRRDAAAHRFQRDVRKAARPAGQRRVHQPKRRALHGDSRLEPDNQVGFSAFVSIGSMLDVDWGDLIYHLGDDPHTRSILLYMESVGDARSFLSAAREVALTKPIIVIKVGRTEAAAKAAASHTGALTGSDEVLDAAFRRVGVLRVDTIAELFDMAEVLAKQPRPAGPRLAIVTNAGGPGVLATDALIECGGKLAELSGKTFDPLNKLLPPHWSHGNPIDILGDASPETYAKAVEIVARDENNDGLLVILAPQAMTDPTRNRRAIASVCKTERQADSRELDGRPGVRPGEAILDGAGIPTFEYPDAAARAFCAMWRYSHNLDALYETPALDRDRRDRQSTMPRQIIDRARKGSARC